MRDEKCNSTNYCSFMHLKNIVIFIVLFFSFQLVRAQLTSWEANMLRLELSERINALRVSQGLNALHFNDTLRKAALFHSVYMADNDVLTHEQKLVKFGTPKARVDEFKGKKFRIIGENVLYSTPQKFPLSEKEITALAEEMFLGWKNSPGHYANMISPDFTHGDFGFKANANKKIVYATHVLGALGISVPNQLSTDAFGLQEAPQDCEKQYEQYFNRVLNLGNLVRIQGNEVILYYHDMASFKEIFGSAKDGIAVDLIASSQFPCNAANTIDASPIYDGILLRPFYRDELISGNRAEGDYRLITKVGDIPAHLQSKAFIPAVVLIRNGQACKHIYPAYVPHKDFEYSDITPIIMDEPGKELLREGIVASEYLEYEFLASTVTAFRLPTLKKPRKDIHSVIIQSYSSVEGDSVKNSLLHEARAKYIQEHLSSTLKSDPAFWKVDAKENWDEMIFQLNYFGLAELVNEGREALRTRVNAREGNLPWDSLLRVQRTAHAIIHYSGQYDSTSLDENLAAFNLRTAVAIDDVKLANKALFEMYNATEYTSALLFEPAVVSFFKMHCNAIVNYAALLARDVSYDPYVISDLMHYWLGHADELSEQAKFNVLHLYTLLSQHLLDRWDVSAERLSNVIYPKRLEPLMYSGVKSDLALNLHVAFLDYYGQVNDMVNVSRSFYYIADYFKKAALDKEDDVNLALFFNHWGMYHLALEHLNPKLDAGALNEDGVFVLAQTMHLNDFNEQNVHYLNVIKRAMELNTARWCQWVKEDFHLNSIASIKAMYCTNCP